MTHTKLTTGEPQHRANEAPTAVAKAVKVAMEHLLFDVNQPKFRKEMVGDCAIAFLDRGFKRKLNSSMSLVGCKNGVYDFNLRKLRCGRPTDYIQDGLGAGGT